MMIRPALLATAATLELGACTVSEPAANSAAASEAAAVDASGGVTREPAIAEQPAEPPVTPMAAPAVIQSQPGPEGAQVDLLRVAVTGDILTVTMRCSSTDTINSESFGVEDISIVDDATSQRAGVLKDGAGKPMVSDPTSDGRFLRTDCEVKPGVIWAKFPAPSAGAKTVSINFPGIGPFDGIPVTR